MPFSTIPTLDEVSGERHAVEVQIDRVQAGGGSDDSPCHPKGAVKCCDYQEILVQERIQMLEVGTMPRSITIILMDDLVDTCRVVFV